LQKTMMPMTMTSTVNIGVPEPAAPDLHSGQTGKGTAAFPGGTGDEVQPELQRRLSDRTGSSARDRHQVGALFFSFDFASA
jgi:hypothetical protein